VEVAGAGVGELAVWLSHLEEALALNDEIERVIGLRELALREKNFVGGGAGTEPDLKAGGHDGLLSGGRARLNHALVEEILELRAAHLVPGGVGVGQVVGDIVDIHLLRGHPAGSTVECANHR
jgi:hypothetical protein